MGDKIYRSSTAVMVGTDIAFEFICMGIYWFQFRRPKFSWFGNVDFRFGTLGATRHDGADCWLLQVVRLCNPALCAFLGGMYNVGRNIALIFCEMNQ
jgi:hypothetical protein